MAQIHRFVGVGFDKCAEGPESGVVDQVFDLEAPLLDLVEELARAVVGGEVGDDHVGVDLVLGFE